MHTSFQLGDAPPVVLPVREETWLHPQHELAGEPIENVEAATIEALSSPLGYPPIHQAVVPGDRVAIALGEGVRGGADVIRALTSILRQSENTLQATRVVVGTSAQEAPLRHALADLVAEGLDISVHNPQDKSGLVFVASVDERPLRLNRHLGEADVVIPVVCARHDTGLDARGPFETLFPRFFDAETIDHYQQSMRPTGGKTGVRMRRDQTERAGWLLGVGLVIETVPARGGGVAAVLAGESSTVGREASNWCERIWRLTIPARANLVVTTLGGGAEEQTWENVARALHAASRVVDDSQSAVVVCTLIDQEPGPMVRSVADAYARASELDQPLAHASGDDAVPAWELYQALQRGPVYFMGRLPEATVEELGMAPLANYDQLERLMSRSGMCLMINDSQHAVPVVVDQ